MSQLDTIQVEFAEFTVSLDTKARQAIKALLLKLINETRTVECRAAAYEDAGVWVNRDELRAKIEKL